MGFSALVGRLELDKNKLNSFVPVTHVLTKKKSKHQI